MKKVIVALLLLTLLLINLPKPLEDAVGGKESAVTFHFYQQQEGAVFMGTTYRLSVNGSEAAAVRKKYSNIAGTTVRFKGEADTPQKLLKSLSATNVRGEDCGDTVVYTAYSTRLIGSIMTSHGKVNLQIAYSDGFVTVGSPLILGSF